MKQEQNIKHSEGYLTKLLQLQVLEKQKSIDKQHNQLLKCQNVFACLSQTKQFTKSITTQYAYKILNTFLIMFG